MPRAIEEATPFQRLVLLAVVGLDLEGMTPAYSFHVRERSVELLDELESDRFGGVTREEVIKALSVLEAADALVEADREDASPVGKGRPAYALGVAPDTVLDALERDDTVGVLVDQVRE